MKTFLRLDPSTIPSAHKQTILAQNNRLTAVEHEVYLLEFELAEFIHAQSLLSQYPHNYGKNLAIYLPTVINHLQTMSSVGEISLGMGDTDFKRKMSEDFGVALAALFMTRSFDIDWTSVSQVPANKALSLKRPDFQSYNRTGELFFFEAKGTTSPNTLEKQISTGKDQVKKYPKPASGKFVIASYLGGDSGTFPTTTFVYDPPHDGSGFSSPKQVIRFHYYHVLNFMGWYSQAEAYLKLLVADFSLDEKDLEVYSMLKNLDAKGHFKKSMSDLEDLPTGSIGEKEYVFTYSEIETSNSKIEIKRGLSFEIFESLRNGEFNLDILKSLETYNENGLSVFNDGTLLSIKERSKVPIRALTI